jgi:hypothetical protein
VRAGALEQGGLCPRGRSALGRGGPRPSERSALGRGGPRPRGCVTLERGGPYSRGIYPSSEADLTQGAFRCPALVGRGGYQGCGRVVHVF